MIHEGTAVDPAWLPPSKKRRFSADGMILTKVSPDGPQAW
jgi:hypothetical protein